MSDRNELIRKIDETAARGNAVETALTARAVVLAAIAFVYRAANENLPEDETFSVRASGECVRSLAHDFGLVDKLAFVGRLGALALQGHRVKRSQAEVAAANAVDFLAAVRLKVEPGAPAHVFRSQMTEAETRKTYIDTFLEEAGWEVADKADESALLPGKASIEFKVTGMPPHGQDGYCDYVLFGLDGMPLAVVEAKKTSRSPEEGRTQVGFYADRLEARFGVRPVAYMTNGYEIWCRDGYYPERRVYAFHARKDLERIMARRGRAGIADMRARSGIIDRPYQFRAITALCEHFNGKHRRGLLVMATGTGKTRVSVALVDVLMRSGWAQHILFLADRKELVKQAKGAFEKLMPDESVCALSQKHDVEVETSARLVFSTYQTMIHYIDGETKTFTPGHFDLIITDEAHRTIFNKYRAIFNYFDSLLVGLTATPREDVDSNTYDMFGCEQGCPNFDYSLAQGVKDKYLVPFKLRNKTTAILQNGIRYDDLSEEERAHYEERFEEAGFEEMPEAVDESAIFRTVYNECTCDRMLETLMREGQRVESGELIGKSVIFAVNHRHAEMIHARFKVKFPELDDEYCQVIDNTIERSGEKIDEFRDRRGFRIAISVDMLDTGVDVPEIVNLVFFKKVRSKIKFHQMLGRGTRLKSDLFGPGLDKKYFTCFDYLGNFEYFNQEDAPTDDAVPTLSVSQRIFLTRLKIMLALQHVDNQGIEARRAYWEELRSLVHGQVEVIRTHIERMMVKLALPHLDKYRLESSWAELSDVKITELKNFIVPLVEGDESVDERIKLFDERMLKIEKASLTAGSLASVKPDIDKLRKIAKELQRKGAVEAIRNAATSLEKLASVDFWETATVETLEPLRKELRGLMIYLDSSDVKTVGLHIEDVESDVPLGELTNLDLRTYREKVADYLERHMTMPVIQRLRHLAPLRPGDLAELERILWNELGTRADYDAEHYDGTLAGFVRQIVGLDDDAVMEKFGAFLTGNRLNFRQQEFVSDIVDFIRENGEISRRDLAESDPFADIDLSEIFLGRNQELDEILETVDSIGG